jgi:hypothetical protein
MTAIISTIYICYSSTTYEYKQSSRKKDKNEPEDDTKTWL